MRLFSSDEFGAFILEHKALLEGGPIKKRQFVKLLKKEGMLNVRRWRVQQAAPQAKPQPQPWRFRNPIPAPVSPTIQNSRMRCSCCYRLGHPYWECPDRVRSI